MAAIIIDTCLYLDFIIVSRPRHQTAVEFVKYINLNDIKVLVPMTLVFEVAAVLKHTETIQGYVYHDYLSLKTLPIKISSEFVRDYLDVRLPYVKGADFIFLCIAAKHNFPFVTEDVMLYKKSKQANIVSYTMEEYL